MTQMLKEKPIVGVIVAIMLIVAGVGVWFAMQTTSTNTKTAIADDVIEMPFFSVKQQVSESVGVEEDKLSDTNQRIRVKYTIVDDKVYNEGDTIDKLMGTNESASQALLTQIESTAILYDYNADTYVAKLNNIDNANVTSGVKDIAFARDNYNGEVVDGISYDWGKGVVYIPKSLVDSYTPANVSEEEGNVLQAQLMYTMSASDIEDVVLQKATVTNTSNGEKVETCAGSELISNYTYIQLVDSNDGSKIDTASIKVNVNDGAVQSRSSQSIQSASDMVAYNSSTGVLRIENNALALGNISVSFASVASEGEAQPALAAASEFTEVLVRNMNFLKDLSGKEVVFKDLNGTAIKTLLDNKASSAQLLQFYTDGQAVAWDGSVAMDQYVGGTVYASSKVQPFTWEDGSTAYMIDAGIWETITAFDGGYVQDEMWGVWDKAPSGTAYQPKYYFNIGEAATVNNYPISTNTAQYPVGATQSTQELLNAGSSNGGSWDYKSILSKQLQLKAWCTHISEGYKNEILNGVGCVYGRVIAADSYHITLSLIGGATTVENQTGSCIVKIKIANYADLSLKKVSNNTSITEGNNCYSLAGAEYGVYGSKAEAQAASATSKGTPLATLTTDANGNATATDLYVNEGMGVDYYESGTEQSRAVYVKELNASKGYKLDTEIYEVFLKPNETAVLNVKEEPNNDPVNILAQKVNSISKTSEKMGGATLQGAQFTVRYYDTTDPKSLSKDYATRTAAAKKTWVYETNDRGVIWLNNQSPISGDAVYKAADGTTVLPVGTYIVEETLAPTGYLLPDCQNRTFIGVVTGTGTYGVAGNVYKPIGNDEITLSDGTKITLTGLGWTKW